jgi:hypothetical protein
MQPHVGRRAFLGSAGVIGAGSAIALRFAPFQEEVNAQAHDLVDKELRRQLREAVIGLRGTRRGEAARKLASTLRVVAAAYASNGTETTFKTKLRAMIRRDGKDALLLRDIDPRALAAELKEYGVTALPPVSPPDYALRAQTLDRLAAQGLSPQILVVAELFERIAEDVDAGPTMLVSARRTGGQCPDLQIQIAIIEVMMIAACLINPITCAIFSGMYAGLRLSLAIFGCG